MVSGLAGGGGGSPSLFPSPSHPSTAGALAYHTLPHHHARLAKTLFTPYLLLHALHFLKHLLLCVPLLLAALTFLAWHGICLPLVYHTRSLVHGSVLLPSLWLIGQVLPTFLPPYVCVWIIWSVLCVFCICLLTVLLSCIVLLVLLDPDLQGLIRSRIGPVLPVPSYYLSSGSPTMRALFGSVISNNSGGSSCPGGNLSRPVPQETLTSPSSHPLASPEGNGGNGRWNGRWRGRAGLPHLISSSHHHHIIHHPSLPSGCLICPLISSSRLLLPDPRKKKNKQTGKAENMALAAWRAWASGKMGAGREAGRQGTGMCNVGQLGDACLMLICKYNS